MSENGVTRLLLIILVISCSVRYGTPLECYVCTSVENSACTLSLSGIERSTCSSDETTETTLVSTTSTTTLDSGTTSTSTPESTSSTTDATTSKDSSSEFTSISDSGTTSQTTVDSASTIMDATTTENTSTKTSTEDPSTTTIEESTSSATSIQTETTTDESLTSQDNTTQETTSSAVSETTTTLQSNEDSDTENDPIARMVRDADVDFACYTLTLTRDNETVTDRGCVVQSSSMCETLNEEKYPGYNLTTCRTCTEDGCNSSPINLSGIPSLFIPLIMFILTR